MKAYLALISAAVIGLAACSQEPAAPAAPANEPAPAAEHLLLQKLRLLKLLQLLKRLPQLPTLLLPVTVKSWLNQTTLCSSIPKTSKLAKHVLNSPSR